MNKRILLLPLLLLLSSACTVNEPHIPSWDTQWTLVLPTKDFILSDLIKEDSVITADTTAAGIPVFSLSMSDSSDWQRISVQDLSVPPEQADYLAPIGDMQIDDPPPITTDSIYVKDFLPDNLLLYAATHNDTILPFPDFDINPPDNVQEFDDFKRIEIASGSIRLTFYNRMFLTIRPGMLVNIYNDDAQGELISAFTFTDSIPSGSTVQSSVADLSGKTIINRIRVEYFVPVAGSGSSMVLTDDLKNGAFFTMVSISNIVVTLAEAKIPVQEFSQQDSVEMTSGGHRLRQAEINRGAIHISLKNNLPLTSHLDVVLPDIIKDDQAKKFHADIPAGQDYLQTIDLSGWSLVNHKDPSAYIEAIFYRLSAQTDSSDGYVTISSGDSIAVNISVDSLYFNSINGWIDTVKIEIEDTEIETPDALDDFEQGIRLEDLVMSIAFENQLDFPVEVDIQISGQHEENGTVTNTINIPLKRTLQKSSVTTIVLDKNSSTPSIVDLLEILPTYVSVSGNASVGGEGAVQVGQGVRATFLIESPLTIQLKNPVTYEGEVDSVKKEDLDDQAREALTEDIKDAFMQLSLSNGLPVGMQVTLYLAVDSTMLYDEVISDSSKKIVIAGTVNAGQTDAGGYVQTPGEGTITLSLSDNELEIFRNSPLYFRQDVQLQATSGVARFRQNDEISVQAMVKIKYTVNRQDN